MNRARTWSVFDAKAKFSEVVDLAVEQGPQIVTKRGEPTAVILSISDYQRLRGPKESFKEFLSNGPLGDIQLDRLEGPGREIDL